MNDFQRSKCYSWEDLHIHQHDKSLVKFDNAQNLVDYIWKEEGLAHPPRIKKLSPLATKTQAHANRLSVTIPARGIQTTILLHELAHSMTTTHEGRSARHNGRWVGVFIQLLSRYAGFNYHSLWYTAKSAGLEVNIKGKVI